MRYLFILAWALVFNFATPAVAQNAKYTHYLAWNDKVAGQLRLAASYLRTGNTEFAAIALEEFIGAKEFGKISGAMKPIAEKARKTAQASLALIDEGKPVEARAQLMQLRDMLFKAHKTHKIDLFSDCIWQVVKTGPPLWHYKKNPPDFADKKQVAATAKAALDYRRQLAICDNKASAALKAQDDYKRLVANGLESLQRIPDEALKNKDKGQLYRFIIELRSIDRLLFFRFG